MRVLRSFWLVALLSYPLHAAPARTPDAHDVSGTYAIEKVTGAGDKVVVTLELRLNNSGETDFSNSKAVLLSTLPGEKSHGALEPTGLGPHSRDRVTKDFTLSRAEYETWRKGARPSMSITAKAGDGSTVQRTIKLLHLAAGRN